MILPGNEYSTWIERRLLHQPCAASLRRDRSLVAWLYAPVSPRALATTRAPVMVDKSSTARLAERPSLVSLSRHILKKPLTSCATSGGKSCDAAPKTVHGHMCPSETAVPRNAFVHTRTGSGSFSNSSSMNLDVSSAQRRITAAASASFVGK